MINLKSVMNVMLFASMAGLGSCTGNPVGDRPPTLPMSDVVLSKNGTIYVMKNGDSLSLIQLIDSNTTAVARPFISPKLSPDRKKIAFYASKRFPNMGIVLCAVGIGGEDLKILAVVSLPGQSIQVGFDWSPDGQKLAFSSPKDGTNSIYTVRADGTEERRITNNLFDMMPRWSSEGNCLAFMHLSPNPTKPCVAVFNILESKALVLSPRSYGFDWSPTKNQIVFAALPDSSPGSKMHLYLTETDGSIMTQPVDISRGADYGANVAIWGGWNPSANRILVKCFSDTSGFNQNADVFQVDPRTGDYLLLTTLHNAVNATWSEDSRTIFFTKWGKDPADILNAFDLYVMNSDGTGQRLLIKDIGDPGW